MTCQLSVRNNPACCADGSRSMSPKFQIASWLQSLFYRVIDWLPPVLRTFLLRRVLGGLGKDSVIDYGCYLRYPWLISIGSKTYINRNCSFYPSYHERAPIVIGSQVTIAYNVSFIGGSHDYLRLDLPDVGAPITVHDHVWIGCNVVVLPGVTIGEGAVIGAGSVVIADVAPFQVVAGVPARHIKDRNVNAEQSP